MTKKTRFGLVLGILLGLSTLNAQVIQDAQSQANTSEVFSETSIPETAELNKIESPWTVGISYLGNHFVNPGLSADWNYEWHSRLKQKTKTKRDTSYVKNKRISLLWNLRTSFIYFPKNQTMITLGGGLYRKKVKHKGFTWWRGIGVNYVRTFLPETYAFENGEISRKYFSGLNYFAPEFNLGIGKELRNSKRIAARHCKFRFLFLGNYNSSFQPFINVELGVTLK